MCPLCSSLIVYYNLAVRFVSWGKIHKPLETGGDSEITSITPAHTLYLHQQLFKYGIKYHFILHCELENCSTYSAGL